MPKKKKQLESLNHPYFKENLFALTKEESKKFVDELTIRFLEGNNKIPKEWGNLLFNDIKRIVRLAGLRLTIERLSFTIEVDDYLFTVYYIKNDKFYVGTQEDLDVSSQGKDLEELKLMMKDVIQMRFRSVRISDGLRITSINDIEKKDLENG